MITPPLHLVGIVNVTPDSFSDGGLFLSPTDACRQAENLLAAGADIIEVGGDSTRPGSTCGGPDLEWARIEPVVRALSLRCPVAVDTHHASVAERALDLGVTLINDVSAGADPRMFDVVARKGAKLVLMFSRCPSPHVFGPPPSGDIVRAINTFLDNRTCAATDAGVPAERIIRDTGMGGFVSQAPETSWEIMRRFGEVTPGKGGLLFGSSRKGFLKGPGEDSAHDRDPASAMTALLVARVQRRAPTPLYIRTHNVALQKRLLSSFQQ